MSLDERTLDWLKKRRSPQRLALCCRTSKAMKFPELTQGQCCYCDMHRSRSRESCPLVSDFKDVAEFEARVAEKLTCEPPYAFGFCQLCKYNTHGCRNLRMTLKQCRLKHARLAVEAEMKMEGK